MQVRIDCAPVAYDYIVYVFTKGYNFYAQLMAENSRVGEEWLASAIRM